MPCWSILCYSLAFLQGKVWNVVLENSLKPFDHPTVPWFLKLGRIRPFKATYSIPLVSGQPLEIPMIIQTQICHSVMIASIYSNRTSPQHDYNSYSTKTVSDWVTVTYHHLRFPLILRTVTAPTDSFFSNCQRLELTTILDPHTFIADPWFYLSNKSQNPIPKSMIIGSIFINWFVNWL